MSTVVRLVLAIGGEDCEPIGVWPDPDHGEQQTVDVMDRGLEINIGEITTDSAPNSGLVEIPPSRAANPGRRPVVVRADDEIATLGRHRTHVLGQFDEIALHPRIGLGLVVETLVLVLLREKLAELFCVEARHPVRVAVPLERGVRTR